MLLFSLAMSLSPGPVNLVILASGAVHGARRTVPFVTGATLGFACMLAGVGLVIGPVLSSHHLLTQGLRWGGLAFILYLAWRIAMSETAENEGSLSAPGWRHGAVVQCLNPKAWIACASGTALFAPAGDVPSVLCFVAVYGVVCGACLMAWAVLGQRVSQYLTTSLRKRLFNTAMGVAMAASALYALHG